MVVLDGVGRLEEQERRHACAERTKRKAQSPGRGGGSAPAQPDEAVSGQHAAGKEVEIRRKLPGNGLVEQATARRRKAKRQGRPHHRHADQERMPAENQGQQRKDQIELHFDCQAPKHGVVLAERILVRVIEEEQVIG